ncbi:hypothetical protein [Streptomyces sp. NPDC097619]|uniref:hypothetical protein n=1 Tax=Streptomyces sp. NPDC097619 TaxID=3157228 RepID=UPI00333346F7
MSSFPPAVPLNDGGHGHEYGPRMDAVRRPTPEEVAEIEERFVALIEGRLSRDEADRWAARRTAAEGLDWDDTSWWALNPLHGVDLPAGPDGRYLHDEEQLRTWLTELRHRRRTG